MLAAVKTLKVVQSPSKYTAVAIDEIDGVRSTDLTGLERMFREHHDRVFRTAYRVTGSPADAEDVLQTVFLRLARGLETTASAENPQAYFARAAINASLDLLRRRKRAKSVSLEAVDSDAKALSTEKTPESSHEDRELRELLRQAVSKLGQTAAQMFTLRYFEGYGNAEIAEMMQTSPLVVGVTLHRARARLRKEIGTYIQAST